MLDFDERVLPIVQDETVRLREQPGRSRLGDSPALFSGIGGGVQRGTLEFKGGAGQVTVRGEAGMAELYRASFERNQATATSEGGEVRIRYRRPSFGWRSGKGEIVLNPSIPWQIAVRGGMSRLDGDPWPAAVIGTLGTGRPPAVESNGLTTPDPVLLQSEFRRFADQGLKACAIEASSIGLSERRLDGTRIAVAVFTNFTQDHLDYHGSMETYWAAKAELFRWPGLRCAVVNIDDPKGTELEAALRGRLDVWTCSSERPARLQAVDVGYADGGLRFDVVEGNERVPVAAITNGNLGPGMHVLSKPFPIDRLATRIRSIIEQT